MGTTALIALITGNAALADVTPEEVWENWKGFTAAYGLSISTESESRAGDTLVIGGLSLLSEHDDMRSVMTIDQILFRDTGDGAVEITLSNDYQWTITTPNEPGSEPTDIALTISSPGATVRASGAAAETRYDFSAPAIDIALNSVDGVDAEALGVDIGMSMTESTGSTIVTGTDDKAISSNLMILAVDVLADYVDPEGKSTLNFSATLAHLASFSSGILPAAADLTDMAAALRAGFSTDGSLTYGNAGFTFDFAEGDQTATGEGSAESGNLTVAINEDQLAYGGWAKGIALKVSGSDIPFPEVALGYDASAFNFVMPISKSPEPADFALMTRIIGLTVSDDIWAMFDPTGALPRDPLTLIIDTKGKATLDVDLLDPLAMAIVGDGAPGELRSLEVTELKLTAAGTEVMGSGALTFDNSDTVTFDGVPKPTGTVTLNAAGINGLMDKLVQMGLLPEDQVSGMRMMLGLFARPGVGEDTLISTLEFKDGGFFANGMQLK